MAVFKRIVAGIALILAALFLLLSLAGGVGVWLVKEPLTDRATALFGRIDTTLDLAARGLDQAQASLARAAERLDAVQQEQQKLAGGPRNTSPTRRVLARTVQQRVAPQIGDAQVKVQAFAEATIVVNSVWEDLGNLPFLSTSGLDAGRLNDITSRLSDVTSSAWELSRLLGDSEADADAEREQFSRIEQALKTPQGWLTDYEPRRALVRQRAEVLKSQTLTWIGPATVVASLVCFWIALSQVSLLANAWSWWRAR
jgi:uncharacterized phage infection (PIP) family protein YhgE